jgi:ribonuclease HI
MELTAALNGLRMIPKRGSVTLMVRNPIIVNVLRGSELPSKHNDLWRCIQAESLPRSVNAVTVRNFVEIDRAIEQRNKKEQREKARMSSTSELETLPLFDHDITIYTNGANSNKVCGWAFLLHNKRTGEMETGAGSIRQTNVNRMKHLAIVEGLKRAPQNGRIRVLTDMKYLADGITYKIDVWHSWGWRKSANGCVERPNPDLWEDVWQSKRVSDVRVDWVRSNTGIEGQDWCATEATRQVDIALRKRAGEQAELPRLDSTQP